MSVHNVSIPAYLSRPHEQGRSMSVSSLSEAGSFDGNPESPPSAGKGMIRDSREQSLQFSGVKLPALRRPKSHYAGWEPPLPICSEIEAIDDLLAAGPNSDKSLFDDGFYFDLAEFSIYQSEHSRRSGNFVHLHELMTQIGTRTLQFDGIIQYDGRRRWVQDVQFEILSISGYEVDQDTVTNQIYIRSSAAAKRNVWYQLREPAPEYACFYSDFLWLADFAKHFTCYLQEHQDVCLADFRLRFHQWVTKQYSGSMAVQDWYSRYGIKDFRKVVAAHPRYLRGEACNDGVDYTGHNWKQRIWLEVDPDTLGAVKRQHYNSDAPTLVTPYVQDCFQDLYFADQLQARTPTHEHHKIYRDKWRRRLSWRPRVQNARPISNAIPGSLSAGKPPKVRSGDVVGLSIDPDGLWKGKSSIWYAYIHDMEIEEDGRERLHLLWLYQKEDTICLGMRYPYANELFFSDHCNCRCRKAERIYVEDVMNIPKITLFTDPLPEEAGFFIRQTYVTEDAANHFITLEASHLECEHRIKYPATPLKYLPESIGVHSTVLVELPHSDFLEPAVVVGLFEDGRFMIQEFMRKQKHDTKALPNELILTDKTCVVPRRQIIRSCNIRAYTCKDIETGKVPAPYSYGGAGDCWILSSKLQENDVVYISETFKPTFKEGFDPNHLPSTTAPLRALDLFCGTGNLGRGLEDAGAVRVDWAVDIDATAIHTKLANGNLASESLYWGSAVRYMKHVMHGHYSKAIAAIGSVQLIVAGSPCQGFSNAQHEYKSDRSRRNASMVTLVLAFIDLYRPEYALLENVFGMTRPLGDKKDQQVFAQILCALIGMGYQARCCQIDAANHGSGQTRTRIIISIAAPGLKLLNPPQPTHTSPGEKSRAICRTINGAKFGEKMFPIASYKFVTAQEATSSLPETSDDRTSLCIRDPEHRVSMNVSEKWHDVIPYIPRHPRGARFASARAEGRIPQHLLAHVDTSKRPEWVITSKNHAYWRVDPNKPFDTVLTVCQIGDSRSGKWLHWNQNRPITVAEARRAQSFPDHEVLIGTVAQQWKLVGNGVSRYVAAAFGVKLREAWLESNDVFPNLELLPGASAATTKVADQGSADYDAFGTPSQKQSNLPVSRPSQATQLSPQTDHAKSTNSDSSDIIVLATSDQPSRKRKRGRPALHQDRKPAHKALDSDDESLPRRKIGRPRLQQEPRYRERKRDLSSTPSTLGNGPSCSASPDSTHPLAADETNDLPSVKPVAIVDPIKSANIFPFEAYRYDPSTPTTNGTASGNDTAHPYFSLSQKESNSQSWTRIDAEAETQQNRPELFSQVRDQVLHVLGSRALASDSPSESVDGEGEEVFFDALEG